MEKSCRIDDFSNPNEDCLERLLSHHGPSQLVYSHLIKKISLPPLAIEKWNIQFNIDEDDWESIFQNPYYSVRDVKIQYFQFRFLHRILGTNRRLFLMKIKDSPLCSFCKIEEESIEHLFWNCHVVSSFILDLEVNLLKRNFVFSKEDIFFGYNRLRKHPFNFLIYHAKYYIFQCKQCETLPNFNDFMHKFRYALEVEKCISNSDITKTLFSYHELMNVFIITNILSVSWY